MAKDIKTVKQPESLSSKAYLWLGLFFSVFIWSGMEPKDRLTWVLEAGPAIIGLWVMAKTRMSFPLTPLLYFWVLLHCIVLMAYTTLRTTETDTYKG